MVSPHHAKVKIDVNLEGFKEWPQKLFMLARRNHDGLKKSFTKFVDHRSKLDHLRTCAEEYKYLHSPIDLSEIAFLGMVIPVVEHRHLRPNVTIGHRINIQLNILVFRFATHLRKKGFPRVAIVGGLCGSDIRS